MIRVGYVMNAAPGPPEPAFHPHHPPMLVFDAIVFGMAIGAVYVFGRALGETFRL